MNLYKVTTLFFQYAGTVLIILTLIFSCTWQKSKGKVPFIIFLSLLLAGYLNSLILTTATMTGIYRYYQIFRFISLFLLVAKVISLIVFVVISKTLAPGMKTKARPFFLVFFILYLGAVLTNFVLNMLFVPGLTPEAYVSAWSAWYRIFMVGEKTIILTSIVFLLVFTILRRNITPLGMTQPFAGDGKKTFAQVLFSLKGRIPRSDYWLKGVLVLMPLGIIQNILIYSGSEEAIIPAVIIWLFTLWPGLAVSIKRLHDLDHSWWFLLIGLIPLIGPLWLFIEMGFLMGTIGPNRFGNDPLKNNGLDTAVPSLDPAPDQGNP